jgi:hypothetical protein
MNNIIDNNREIIEVIIVDILKTLILKKNTLEREGIRIKSTKSN